MTFKTILAAAALSFATAPAFAADVEEDRPGHAGKALHLARDVTAGEADDAAHRAGISSAK